MLNSFLNKTFKINLSITNVPILKKTRGTRGTISLSNDISLDPVPLKKIWEIPADRKGVMFRI